MAKLVVGINNLATLHPEVAAEADGWDPTTVLAGSHKKMPWKCQKGHQWKAVVNSRSIGGSNCPQCAEYGFNPGKPAWFYLMERNGEQQFGITNDLPRRLSRHNAEGWNEIEFAGPNDGKKVFETERQLKKWLKKEIGLVPDKQENWYTSKMKVHSLAELKKKSGIETSIF